MKDRPIIHLVNPRKTWTQRIFGSLLKTDCCGDGPAGERKDYSCTCSGACTTQECAVESPVAESPLIDQPDGHTIQSLSSGETAYVGELYLSPALKKRMLSMGLTNGTKISVISKEGGRMIIAVRDSRLGLSPEMATRITCRPVRESVELCR